MKLCIKYFLLFLLVSQISFKLSATTRWCSNGLTYEESNVSNMLNSIKKCGRSLECTYEGIRGGQGFYWTLYDCEGDEMVCYNSGAGLCGEEDIFLKCTYDKCGEGYDDACPSDASCNHQAPRPTPVPAPTDLECRSHSECDFGEYCDTNYNCWACGECAQYDDSITGSCSICSLGTLTSQPTYEPTPRPTKQPIPRPTNVPSSQAIFHSAPTIGPFIPLLIAFIF